MNKTLTLAAFFSLAFLLPFSYADAESLPLELETPEKPVYYQVKSAEWDSLYVYAKISPGIYSLVLEQEDDAENFALKYEAKDFRAIMQYDFSFNGSGKWLYKSSWDQDEGNFGAAEKAQNVLISHNLINEFLFWESYHEELEAAFADVPGFIYKDSDDKLRFNFNDTSIAIRCRYLISWTDKEDNPRFLAGPWSETGYIGKNAEKAELPAFDGILPPPQLSSLRFVDSSVEFIINNSEKLYDLLLLSYFNGKYQANSYETQYRINGGEWRSFSVPNASWFYDGRRSFQAEGLFDGDLVEIQARYIYSEKDEQKYSEWSEILSNETETVKADDAEGKTALRKSVCLLGLSFCCFTFLGISSCIWIAAIAFLLLVFAGLALSRKKA